MILRRVEDRSGSNAQRIKKDAKTQKGGMNTFFTKSDQIPRVGSSNDRWVIIYQVEFNFTYHVSLIK